jgi:hypothetical protein
MIVGIVARIGAYIAMAALTLAAVTCIPRAASVFDPAFGDELQPLFGVKLLSTASSAHLFVVALAAGILELAIVAEAALERFNHQLAGVMETSVQAVSDANPGGVDPAVVGALRAAGARPKAAT